MSETLTDVLVQAAVDKAAAEAISDPVERAAKARDILVSLLFFTQRFMGQDLLAAACGQPPSDMREDALILIARRASLFSTLFASLPNDTASLDLVAQEAVSVAAGDDPILFAGLGQRKSKHRLHRAKYDAILWDAYFEKRGLSAAQRRPAISVAFGEDWQSIRKWGERAVKVLGEGHMQMLLLMARDAGSSGARFPFNNSFLETRSPTVSNEELEASLKRDGRNYRDILRRSSASA